MRMRRAGNHDSLETLCALACSLDYDDDEDGFMRLMPFLRVLAVCAPLTPQTPTFTAETSSDLPYTLTCTAAHAVNDCPDGALVTVLSTFF